MRPRTSLAGLETAIAAAHGDIEQVTPLFAALLSIPTGDRYPPLELSPQQQKDATVAALVNHFLGLAREHAAGDRASRICTGSTRPRAR